MAKEKAVNKKYVRGVIFDLDGTLVDSKKDIISAINYMFRTMGLEEKTEEAIESYIGFGKDKLISGALAGGATPQNIRKADRIFSKYYRAHMFDNTRLYPGVLEILEYLKDKALMIATNKNLEVTGETLRHFAIDKYFVKVMGGDDTNCRKPDACPIDILLNDEGISKEKAIIIGDSHIDIKSGKRAGILTCALTYGIGRVEDIKSAGPDYVLDDLLKLKEIIC